MSAEWEPGRWWRVIGPDGSMWCETSSEEEARDALRLGFRLENLWSRTEYEWRAAQ